MTKLKLGPITEDKPIKVTLELPAALHRDLVAYAEALARERAANLLPIQNGLSCLCWSGLLRRIEDLRGFVGSVLRPTKKAQRVST